MAAGLVVPGRAGPGGIFCTLRNVAAAASPSGAAAGAAAAALPGLGCGDCGFACAVPRRAVRGGAEPARQAARAGAAAPRT